MNNILTNMIPAFFLRLAIVRHAGQPSWGIWPGISRFSLAARR
ncbi:hypothetical protein [Brevibacillus ruminantium]|nr:hypothetical protein [Brevibacillus ruminantium]